MGKFERIIRIPAVMIERGGAQEIALLMHQLAELRVTAVLRERLLQTYQQANNLFALGPVVAGQQVAADQAAIEQAVQSEGYRDLIRPTFGDKYTFLSPHGNVQFLYNDFSYEDIPPDALNVIAESSGPNGEIVNLNIKARTQVVDFNDSNINRVLVQGPNSAWVSDVAQRFETLMKKSKDPFRDIVYRWMAPCIWMTFAACIVLEYKLLRFTTGYRWTQPLNGLQLLSAFAALAVTLILCANLFSRLLPFLWPYFELEGNLSLRRKSWRWPILVAISVLYSSAIAILFATK
ncbi:MAG TPA: hypothetical protein VKA02_03165 [Candidatus Acidoferrum sp.]|nr:hypothetical protein [Candidatus Acidoferrum sp.]